MDAAPRELFRRVHLDDDDALDDGTGSRGLGYALVIGSFLFFSASMYAIVFSKLLPATGHPLLDAVQDDVYYCCLVPLMVYPTGAAIYLSWVSMKFFRHN